MTSAAHPQKFGFDTCFDSTGQIISAPQPRTRRVYSAAEVEVLKAHAFAEGQEQQRRSDEGRRAQALSEIAAACAHALPALGEAADAHRAEAAQLALSVGEAVAYAALERFPRAPLNAALEALSGEIGTVTRLIVRASGVDAETAAMLEKAGADAGLPGRVIVRDEPGLAPTAFIIEWPDGRAEFDPQAAADRVREALQAALAAEPDIAAGEL